VAPRGFSLESAFDAAARDDLAGWVGAFLASRGSDNATLAAGLATAPHWWAGPVRVPIATLVPLAGPSPDVVCQVPPDEWEHDVDAMEESIEEGWSPPPLIAEHRDGRLLLQDGNHRLEALRRAEAEDAWVIVWFDDEAERDRFITQPPARFITQPPARVVQRTRASPNPATEPSARRSQ
jgi:hypothetical protein